MSRTSALRCQHDAASALASRLQDEIERHRTDRDALGISITLAREDEHLYPLADSLFSPDIRSGA